jgi:hypothetical protein
VFNEEECSYKGHIPYNTHPVGIEVKKRHPVGIEVKKRMILPTHQKKKKKKKKKKKGSKCKPR